MRIDSHYTGEVHSIGAVAMSRNDDTEIWIRLADGQLWPFPAPPEPAGQSELCPFGSDYVPLLNALFQAEDEPERRRAELALAIHLFHLRHQVPPESISRLFLFPPESAELAEAQAGFQLLSTRHVRAIFPDTPPGVSPATAKPNIIAMLLHWTRNLFRAPDPG